MRVASAHDNACFRPPARNNPPVGEASEEIDRALAERLQTLGELAATFEHDPGQTIRPQMSTAATLHSGVRPKGGGSTGDLRVVAQGPWRDRGEPLELLATLGEGGMGMVHLGIQRSLGRKVAVKAIKPDLMNERTVAKLLSEARVTGLLEHPNIVPVHDIAAGVDGAPLIVLKRIEGESWSRLIRDPDTLAARFEVDDPLEWHLSVLMQVCNAVHFAHSRGVLHRDLKPDNVMIGAFGEVYVLDWGLAVRLEDASMTLDHSTIPAASEQTQIAGTPSYMAPEMLGTQPSRLCRQTDVYLLGAMLYEVLTGRAPHVGEGLFDVLISVSKSNPTFDDDVPDELAAIVRRAMARHAKDRFDTADDVRLAVADLLRHRGSIRLSEAAEEKLGALESAAADAPLQSIFAECRFAFRLALEEWPENGRALEGLERATLGMAERALLEDDARAAARLLGELADPPKELAERVRAGLDAERNSKDELARVRRELDPTTGRKARVVFSLLVGVFWTLGPIFGDLLETYGRSAWDLAGPPLAVLVATAIATYALRDVALRTVLNRQLIGAACIVMIAEITIHLGGAAGGLAPAQTHAIALLIFSVATSAMGLMVANALFAPGLAYVVAFVVALVWPDLRFVAQASANLVMTIVVVRVWVLARHPLHLEKR